MAKPVYHSSIEGAQHGSKGLDGFLAFAKDAGAAGAQPSNYMLEDGDSGEHFKSAKDIKTAFEQQGLKLDGVSGHCPFWVHTSVWTGTKSGHPFIHGPNQDKSPEDLEQWYEDYLLRLMDLCAELDIKILPMFWGVSHGWELATGYPWGFWAGGDFDLVKAGKNGSLKKQQNCAPTPRVLEFISHTKFIPAPPPCVPQNSVVSWRFVMETKL